MKVITTLLALATALLSMAPAGASAAEDQGGETWVWRQIGPKSTWNSRVRCGRVSTQRA